MCFANVLLLQNIASIIIFSHTNEIANKHMRDNGQYFEFRFIRESHAKSADRKY